MAGIGHTVNRGASRWYAARANLEALAALALIAIGVWALSSADAGPAKTHIVYGHGRIVPIPASVPHEAGDMVDNRIVPDLVWIAQRYPIYVTDGYSGPLPGGGHAGCNRCHTRGSDHYNGLAVDLVPIEGGTTCNAKWAPITRLAHWAEPSQEHPVPPFRWVGYDGDAGHGCGNHLHLSWNHAPAPEYKIAEWVEVFTPAAAGEETSRPPKKGRGSRPPKPALPKGPPGGISQVQTGGVSARPAD
jgi:hypothetical protein